MYVMAIGVSAPRIKSMVENLLRVMGAMVADQHSSVGTVGIISSPPSLSPPLALRVTDPLPCPVFDSREVSHIL
jgi:hypothetical protein